MIGLSLFSSIGTLTASAADAVTDSKWTVSDDTVDFSCYLDNETSKIHLKGVIRHDVFVMHSDYTVEVYAIPPGYQPQAVIDNPNVSAVASSAIAIKFEFVLDAKSVVDRYSQYCVVLRSSDGTDIVVCEPKFVQVESSFSYDANDRSSYKGIATSQVSAAAGAGAGRVVIPVYIDRLIGQSSGGYLYQMGTENLYFDKTYVDSLDIDVRSATAAGAEVYLQYLYATDGESEIPNVYDASALSTIEGMTSFLCERYENFQSGRIDGIVVGLGRMAKR